MGRRSGSAVLLVAVLVARGAARAQDASSPAPTPDPPAAPAEETSAGPSVAAEPAATPAPEIDCLARELDPIERDILLRIAWRTLSGHLTGDPIRDSDLESYAFTPCLMAARGAFVALRKGEQVRGLQGEIEPTRPLYQQVIVFTRRAATRDPRFLPLTERDLGGLTVELSIIGERRRVGGPAGIDVESHGVFLEKWGRRALFLPGVAARQGWSAERTLDELCAQAALPKGSWAESARIEVFSTEQVAGGPPADPPPAAAPDARDAPSPPPSPVPAVSPSTAPPSGG